MIIDHIHILLVSDDVTCEKELTSFLQAQPDFIVSVARSQEEAKRLLLQELPDVGLLKLELNASFAGLDIAMELLEIGPIKLILLVSSIEEKDAIIDAFTIGVLNIVDKLNYEDIPAAIREAYSNRVGIHPAAAALLRKEIGRLRKQELHRLLTPTEKQVLDLLLQGCTRREIVEKLNMAPNTVKFHLRGLIKKIGARQVEWLRNGPNAEGISFRICSIFT